MFWKQVYYAHQGCIYLIKNTVKLWNRITVSNNCFLFWYMLKCNLFLWCKSEFSASFLEYSVSHGPSEIILICWFAAHKFFVLLSMLKTVLLLYIFVEIVLNFLQDSMMNRKSKRTAFICNIIIAFYCHFRSIVMHPCLIKVYIYFSSSPHSLLCEHDCPIWHVSPSVRNVVISPRILQLANPKTNHPNFTSNRQVWIYRSNIAFKPRTGA